MLFVFLILVGLTWLPFVDDVEVWVCKDGVSPLLLLPLSFDVEENNSVESARPPVVCAEIFMIFGQCWRQLVKNGFVTPIIRPGLNLKNLKVF